MKQHPLPSSLLPSQRPLWRVTKGDNTAEAVQRELPGGDEIRVYVRGELLTSTEFHGDAVKLETFSSDVRASFLKKGWLES